MAGVTRKNALCQHCGETDIAQFGAGRLTCNRCKSRIQREKRRDKARADEEMATTAQAGVWLSKPWQQPRRAAYIAKRGIQSIYTMRWDRL